MSRERSVGLWMIGACGSVAGSVALGLAALKRGLTGTTGLVSALPAFEALPLPDPRHIIIGGHEVRATTVTDAVWDLHRRAGLFEPDMIRACADDLIAAQDNIVQGTPCGANAELDRTVGASRGSDRHDDGHHRPAEIVARLTDDLRTFRRRHELRHVVVVNVASCEADETGGRAPDDERTLEHALRDADGGSLATSSLYALAAIDAECAYVNFTPSIGIDVPALRRRADARGLPYAGRDGKTGETLVKSVLAPMFTFRNLKVLSWVGHNMLGNRDGRTLRDAAVRAAKIRSKDGTISGIIANPPTMLTSIHYVPSLDDWKVAWDFVQFEGFLGTRMNMQFTWQGSDSMLAAPLVIDLTRLAALALERGQRGAMTHLACFFKSPMDVPERDTFTQWGRLIEYASAASAVRGDGACVRGDGA